MSGLMGDEMTDVTIKVTCTASGGYKVRIDDELVEFNGHKKTLALATGRHSLTYLMWGNPGQKITIEAKAGATDLADIKDREIPKNTEIAHGAKYIEVPQ